MRSCHHVLARETGTQHAWRGINVNLNPSVPAFSPLPRMIEKRETTPHLFLRSLKILMFIYIYICSHSPHTRNLKPKTLHPEPWTLNPAFPPWKPPGGGSLRCIRGSPPLPCPDRPAPPRMERSWGDRNPPPWPEPSTHIHIPREWITLADCITSRYEYIPKHFVVTLMTNWGSSESNCSMWGQSRWEPTWWPRRWDHRYWRWIWSS